jgi:hypothetical protein
MIIALAIIGFVTIVAINGQTQFNRSLSVTDTAYTVALSVRQAQTFGLSSRTFGTSASNAGYGVHLTGTPPLKTYALFADVSKATYSVPSWCPVGTAGQPDAKIGNCMFDPGGSETVQNFSFGRGFTITNYCGHDMLGVSHCAKDAVPLTALDVLFSRPNTDSIITGIVSGNALQLKDAQIELTAQDGVGTRAICVTAVGEVSVASTMSVCP